MGIGEGALDQRLKGQRERAMHPTPEDEEMDLELERPALLPLNRRRSVFDADGAGLERGINSAPSVFDRSAVFRTGAGGGPTRR